MFFRSGLHPLNCCVGFGLNSVKVFSKPVDELGKAENKSFGFLIACRKIKAIMVNGFIAGEPTGLTQLLHSRVKAKTLNFLLKGAAFSSNSGNQSLKANTKECSRSAWRQVRDALRLFKHNLHVLRHPLDWFDAASCWVTEFPLFPKREAIATQTSGDRDGFWHHDSAVLRNVQPVNHANDPAVWARKNFLAKNWRMLGCHFQAS